MLMIFCTHFALLRLYSVAFPVASSIITFISSHLSVHLTVSFSLALCLFICLCLCFSRRTLPLPVYLCVYLTFPNTFNDMQCISIATPSILLVICFGFFFIFYSSTSLYFSIVRLCRLSYNNCIGLYVCQCVLFVNYKLKDKPLVPAQFMVAIITCICN